MSDRADHPELQPLLRAPRGLHAAVHALPFWLGLGAVIAVAMVVIATMAMVSGRPEAPLAALVVGALLAAANTAIIVAAIRRSLRVVIAADVDGNGTYQFECAWHHRVTVHASELRSLRRVPYRGSWGMPVLRSYRLDTDQGIYYLPATRHGEPLRADLVSRSPQLPAPGVRKPHDQLRRHRAYGDRPTR